MDTNQYESIVGRYFDCKNDPPLPSRSCPVKTKLPGYSGPVLDDFTGEWTCPLCLAIVKVDNDEDSEMYDDDEDEAFDNDEDFTAEGDRIQDQTDEMKIRVTRLRAIEELVVKVLPINERFARYLSLNQYSIVDTLRILEEAAETGFELGAGKPVAPKIIALTSHQSGLMLTPTQLRMIGLREASITQRLRVLKSLQHNDSAANPFVQKIHFIGKSIGLSSVVLDILVEQYEEIAPIPNREPDESTKAAAWIYLKGKEANLKGITKKKLKNIPSVKTNALDRAIESYKVNLQNRIKPVEGVATIDVD